VKLAALLAAPLFLVSMATFAANFVFNSVSDASLAALVPSCAMNPSFAWRVAKIFRTLFLIMPTASALPVALEAPAAAMASM